VAALPASRITSLGDRVGAVVFSENGIIETKPRGREASVRPILAAVTRHNQALRIDENSVSDPGLLNEALRRAARSATHDWLVCLITDASGADESTAVLITRIMAHNDLLLVFVSDPLEEELPDIGGVVMVDARALPTLALGQAADSDGVAIA